MLGVDDRVAQQGCDFVRWRFVLAREAAIDNAQDASRRMALHRVVPQVEAIDDTGSRHRVAQRAPIAVYALMTNEYNGTQSLQLRLQHWEARE